MARRSIEDVMNEIEDFLNSCKTTALSSSKVVVPREEFDELFGELKVKIPAEIDRCKKIMRNKEAILMDARKTADGIIAEATAKANQMVSETEVMALANQQAYETVEMARVQANEMLANATSEANEIRLGSMQYTNDIMTGIRNYVEATMEAERANYENLLAALNNDYLIANANLTEIQNQIVEFTGDPTSVTKAPEMKSARSKREERVEKPRTSMAQKMKQAVGIREEKKEETKPVVDIPDFVTSGATVVPSETKLEANVSVQKEEKKTVGTVVSDSAIGNVTATGNTVVKKNNPEIAEKPMTDGVAKESSVGSMVAEKDSDVPKKVKKKIVKKRNPVMRTPQTAQETVAKTVEAASAAKSDMNVYKANGEQAREVPAMEGRVKRGLRVGRGMVEEAAVAEDAIEVTEQSFDSVAAPGKSMGVIDDFSMEEKF